MAEKAGYKHFMLKEIFEQPTAVQETILGRVSLETRQGVPEEIEIPDAGAARRRARRRSSRAARRGTRRWSASS